MSCVRLQRSSCMHSQMRVPIALVSSTAWLQSIERVVSLPALPSLQPQPDQPLASCNQFERVWSFDPAEWLVRAAVLPVQPNGSKEGLLGW